MVRYSQDRLEWNNADLDLVPHWTREPSFKAIEIVCRRELSICAGDACTISFYAAGDFIELSLASTASPWLIRISLPVHPRCKTCGEVAILQWIRDNTDIPVPKVVAIHYGNDNKIGFEWILVVLVPGLSAYRRWRAISMEQKVTFTSRIAQFKAQLSHCGDLDTGFKAIGTLTMESENGIVGMLTTFVPSQLKSHKFFMGNHLRYSVPRGPFLFSHDWLSSVLNIIILEQTAAIEKAEDDDDRKDAEGIPRPAQ